LPYYLAGRDARGRGIRIGHRLLAHLGPHRR
jgi:hypothetical protein